MITNTHRCVIIDVKNQKMYYARACIQNVMAFLEENHGSYKTMVLLPLVMMRRSTCRRTHRTGLKSYKNKTLDELVDVVTMTHLTS